MKNPFLKVAAILSVVLFVSCSSDNSPSVQNPLEKYLSDTGFDEFTHETVNSVYFESGLRFVPKVNGRLKNISVKFPDNQTNLRVTVWDVETQSIYRTEIISSVVAGIKLTKAITPLTLTKDKEYVISYCANDWYVHRRTDSSDATYPISCGDILITGINFLNVNPETQLFPWDTENDIYAGDLSFGFQPN